MLTQKKFYMLWDIECLKYAAEVAAANKIPLYKTQNWMRMRHAEIRDRIVCRNGINKHSNRFLANKA